MNRHFLMLAAALLGPGLWAAENLQCLVFYRTQGVPSVTAPGPNGTRAIDGGGSAILELNDKYYAYVATIADGNDSLVQMKGTDLKTAKKIDWSGHISAGMLREHSAQLMLPVDGETTVEIEGKAYTLKLESAVFSCRRQ